MNDTTFVWLGLLTALVAGVAFLAGLTFKEQSERVTKLEILACGLYQEEDGSISLEDRDNVRFKCILDRGR